MEEWEERAADRRGIGVQTPKSEIEEYMKRLYEHCELIAAMEDERQFGACEASTADRLEKSPLGRD